MNRFELTTGTPMHLLRVKPGREKGGTEKRPIVELLFRITLKNDDLVMFDPSLKAALYVNVRDTPPRQGVLEGHELSDSPNLRFPKAGKLAWKLQLSGYLLTVHQGIRGRSDIKLEETTLDSFVFDAKEGGTVELKFRAVSAHVDADAIGKLGVLIFRDVDCMLTGPVLPDDMLDEKKPGEQAGAGKGDNWPFPKTDGQQQGGEAGTPGHADGGATDGNPATPTDALIAAAAASTGVAAPATPRVSTRARKGGGAAAVVQ